MHLIPRLESRKSDARRRPATARLRLQTLEDRSLPSFGFGSAFSFGGASSDDGKAIVLDAAGSMYVSGTYVDTVDFDPNGTNPNSNHVLTTETAGKQDGFVAKYSAGGTFQWATDLGRNSVGEIAVQGSNVYVSHSFGPSVGYVSQLDAGTGAIAWTTTITATGSTGAVAVSPLGVVYASGSSGGSASQAIIDRLDPNSGAVLWTQTSTGGSATAASLAVDGAGNAFVAGAFGGTTKFGSTALTSYSGVSETYVWKLDSSGDSVWAGAMGGSGGTNTVGIATDASGNAYVTGEFSGGTNNFNPGSGRAVSLPTRGASDIYTVKLVPAKNGAMQLGWAKDIGGAGYYVVEGMAVDGSGNVYTTGEYGGTVNFNPNSGTPHYLSSSGYAIFVSKLDANGNYVAAASFAGPNDSNALANGLAIAVDGAGNVYTTGYFSGTANFDPTGGTYNLTSNGGWDVFVSVLTQTSPQLAVSRGPVGPGVVPLTQKQLSAVEAVAINVWATAGVPAADIAKMRGVTADITTLSGDNLGAAELNGNEIAIDATADGWGWSVNPARSPAAGRMDLLTVVMHELGHTIGLDSRFSGSSSDLMYAYLAPGERRLPGPADVPAESTAISLLSAAPRPSAEESIDWLSVAATLKPKSGLFTDWLATAGD